jgi:hypothetical protein
MGSLLSKFPSSPPEPTAAVAGSILPDWVTANPDEAQPPSDAPETKYSTANEIHDRTERTS